MPTSPLRPDQIQHILKLYKIYLRKGYTQKDACAEIAELYGRSPDALRVLVGRVTADTTDVAQSYFKANALKMSMRVVRDGSVAQVMDVLERPNIGVLAPKKQVDSGSRGFFLTVSADSCGAVKVGAALIEGGGVPEIPSETEIPSEDHRMWEESQARLQSGGEKEEFAVIDGEVAYDPAITDSLGRPNPAKMMKERGIGRSPSYQAALERARRRIEDAK